MTKSDLVALVANQAGTSAADAEKVLNGFRDVIQAKLKAGEDIAYPGLGKFSRVERKARTGRNPRTGDEVQVPSKLVPYFKTGKELRERVNSWETTADDDDD